MSKALSVFLRKNAQKLYSRFDLVKPIVSPALEGLKLKKQQLLESVIGVEKMEGTNFELVEDFMIAMKQDVSTFACLPDYAVQQLRLDLIWEEVEELQDGIANKDLVEIADALTDILYVVYGTGHAFGIDLDECFSEVHRSNMSKLGEDGNPICNERGKVQKGPNYSEPDLSFILNS